MAIVHNLANFKKKFRTTYRSVKVFRYLKKKKKKLSYARIIFFEDILFRLLNEWLLIDLASLLTKSLFCFLLSTVGPGKEGGGLGL